MTTQTHAVADRSAHDRRAVRRTVGVGVVLGAAVVGLVIWQRHRLSDLPHVLADANWAWIGAAIAFQGCSMAALARLQRRLLNVDGRDHPLGPILATTYAGNAISVSLPIVGSTASAVFAYKRFLHIGAEKAVAAWALAVSGLYSTITFVGLSAIGALLTGSPGIALAGVLTLFAGVVPVVLLLAGVHHPRIQPILKRLLAGILRIGQRLIGKPSGDPVTAAGLAVDQIAQLRMGRRNALMAARFAVMNWTADVACLLCALQAVGATIPWHGVLLAWAAGAGASTLGLTPGGLGVVEATLSVALVAAGLPAGIAVSAVLLYRFIKLWLVLAAGVITLMVIRTRDRRLDIVIATDLPVADFPVTHLPAADVLATDLPAAEIPAGSAPMPSLVRAAPNHLYPVPPIRRQGRDPDRSAPTGRGTGPGEGARHTCGSVRT